MNELHGQDQPRRRAAAPDLPHQCACLHQASRRAPIFWPRGEVEQAMRMQDVDAAPWESAGAVDFGRLVGDVGQEVLGGRGNKHPVHARPLCGEPANSIGRRMVQRVLGGDGLGLGSIQQEVTARRMKPNHRVSRPA